ncbi:phospholipase D1-like isoform X1 [Brachionus plicatilis]|uniref:Phospholipase D1-like isoform X1 n=1 Tax=Brachionus plicatilis TaxID=10195 RepID=A0A3M7QAP3_BRAPC|nr:phospholipase D1-like isoform X1 [Brachionus plicatilis]
MYNKLHFADNWEQKNDKHSVAVKNANRPLSMIDKLNHRKRLADDTKDRTSKKSSGKAGHNDLPIDLDKVDEIEFSKKERVRRKLSQLKKTMKRKGHNPLNRLKRRSPDSDSDSYSDYSDSSDEEAKKSFTEEIIEYPSISNEGHYWIGKDYCNSYKADFKDVSQFSQDQFDRATTPRMPWRDEGLVVIGEAARDLARHFIQRWNQCKREKVRHNYSYPFLLPKSYEQPFDYDFKDWFKDQLFSCEVQMTRSLDAWSGGLSQTESSILNSYCDLINKSEHFIYIEYFSIQIDV